MRPIWAPFTGIKTGKNIVENGVGWQLTCAETFLGQHYISAPIGLIGPYFHAQNPGTKNELITRKRNQSKPLF